MINLPPRKDWHDLKMFLLLSGTLSIFFLVTHFAHKPNVEMDAHLTDTVHTSPFDEVSLVAKSAYVYDARTGQVLFAKDADKRLPLASLTKVMASLVASELAMPESTIVISDDALKAMGDSGLRPGERWSLKDLLDFTLTSSSNDGMLAVALSLGALSHSEATSDEREGSFVSEMNNKADDLGMLNTYFWNVTGLDVPVDRSVDLTEEIEYKGGAYGSAKDMAILFDYILRSKPELLEATKHDLVEVRSLDDNIHVANNTDKIVSELPGIKASKTGFTNVAGGNLVIAFDPEIGRPIIVSVLGSTASDRFADVLALVNATLAYIELEGDPVVEGNQK